jgi:hypothetical protein
MKFVFAVLLLTGLVGLSNAQICGLTDSGVHIPPSYTTLAPPAYGQSYTDPVFGCQITRLVNGTHEYSEMSAFNANDTKIIVGVYGTSGRTIIDFSGNTICYASAIGGNGEPRWDKTDPNKIWFHDIGGNHIYTLNATTCAATLYDTLAPYASTGLWFCGGESDISADGDHFCVSDPATDANSIRRYTISTKTLGTAISGGSSATSSVDFADITPVNNNILVNFGSPRSFEIYNGTTGVFDHQIANWSSHSDRFVGLNDHEMLFTGNGNNPAPGSCSGTSYVAFDLASSGNTPLCTGIDTGQYLSAHLSVNNEYTALPPSRQTVAISIDNDNATWPSEDANWQAKWTAFTNEIIVQNTDGTGLRRLAHHRAINSVGYYWNQTRASMSRSGNWIVYDSNFGRSSASPDDASIDVYLLKLGRSPAPAVARPSAPIGLTVVVR